MEEIKKYFRERFDNEFDFRETLNNMSDDEILDNIQFLIKENNKKYTQP